MKVLYLEALLSSGLVKGEVQISLGLYPEEAVIFRQEAGSFQHNFNFKSPFLGSQQIAQVKALFNYYVDVFAFSDNDLGCTAVKHLEITVTDDFPVCQQYIIIFPQASMKR